MANEIVNTALTATYTVNSFDVVYVSAAGSIITESTAAIALEPSGLGASLFVDGTLSSLASFGGVISLGTSSADSFNELTIGTTGRISGILATGVYMTGHGAVFINHGAIAASYTGVDMSANTTGSGGLTFLNDGAISGYTGVSLSGRAAEGVNNGTVTAEFRGLSLALTAGSFLNNGRVTSAEDGVYLAGESPDFMNAGTIQVLGAGIRSVVDNALITNSGTVAAGGLGIRATLNGTSIGAGIAVVNTGTITAEEAGIEVLSSLATLRSTGSVSAGQTGIFLRGSGADVVVGGSVEAGLSGIDIESDNAQVAVSATVAAQGDWGLHVLGDAAHVDLSGSLLGTVGVAIQGDGADISNTGDITGRAIGMALTSYDPVTPVVGRFRVDNDGVIRGTGGAISVDTGRLDLFNSGEIRSDTFNAISTEEGARVVNTGLIAAGPQAGVAFGSYGTEVDIFRNLGLVIGNVFTAAGNDSVRNRGVIDGDVDLGTGADSLVLRGGGSVSGAVTGGSGGDTLTGGGDDDYLSGDTGNDVIAGGGGNDTLTGGTGRDTLAGGNGADRFVFLAAAETGTGNQRDVIGDFVSGSDQFDLSAFVAGGSFIGAAAFTAGGGPKLRYDAAAGVVEGDTNADGTADFQIALLNRPATLAAGDFLF